MKKQVYPILITLLFGGVLYYFMLPPLNLSAPIFWVFFLMIITVYLVTSTIYNFSLTNMIIKNNKTPRNKKSEYIILGMIAIFFLIIVINLFNSPMFNSKSYYNRIKVNNDNDFTTDIKEVDFNSLPLLDKDSSRKLGDRVMGQMTELVSQFRVSNLYTQINYNEDIIRVTPLEYANVIKYFTNRKNGVKGYIKLNSVTGKAELVKLDKGMRYMPSALFNENLYRKIRFAYPTVIFGTASFEIDDEGKPYWIIPTLKYTGVGLKEEVTGVVVFDPITGDSTKYDNKSIPNWIDHVFASRLIIEQLNDWGKYERGFFNSIFGQKNVVMTTEGYNYTIMNGDVYLYTGITSVASDESNVGFVLSNLRTKETNYYPVSGAEEFSAMASAEGQVQHLKYKASFPLLINLNNKPTYLLSLKDNAGLVKMYAFVDVADYQKVVVTEAKDGIEKAARNFLGDDFNKIDNDDLIQKNIVVKKINEAIIDGTTYYYLIDKDNNRYKVSIVTEPNLLPFIEVGSNLNISYQVLEEINEIIKINK
ncbi:MAG: hypothetical protein PHD10_03190 [Bacilli bacterium]|nr:hypothetical protein [Bacilli bacterium]MDD4608117.1 hypothetical protein [Bacilli bacterium]